MSYRSTVTTVTALGSYAGHEGGDYAVQSDRCARIKQQQNAEGRKALLIHGATYAATQFVTKAAFYRIAGVRVPFIAQAAGTLAEGVAHVVIDDGRLLAKFAKLSRKWGFHQLGAPRQVMGVVDMGNGDIHPVHLVQAETGDDGRRVPRVQLDDRGDVIDTVPTWDNPSPSTGRALLDQALHKWIQIPLGVAVTTGVAAWMHRKR